MTPPISGDKLATRPINLFFLKSNNPQEITDEILTYLGKKNIPSLLIEGGPNTWEHFARHELCKKVYLFTNNKNIIEKNNLTWKNNFHKRIYKEKTISLHPDTLTELDLR